MTEEYDKTLGYDSGIEFFLLNRLKLVLEATSQTIA